MHMYAVHTRFLVEGPCATKSIMRCANFLVPDCSGQRFKVDAPLKAHLARALLLAWALMQKLWEGCETEDNIGVMPT